MIAVPPEGSSGKSRKWLFLGLGAVVVVILIAIVASIFSGSGGEQVAQTPTPSPTSSTTLAPQTRSLTAYFGNPAVTVTLQSATAQDDFKNALLTAQPTAAQATGMAVQMNGSLLAPGAFLQAVLGTIPAGLPAALGSDMAVLAYGQTEFYDANGQKVTGTVQARLALVIELTDATVANQVMQTWEGTGLASVSEPVFGFQLASRIVEGFNTGTYRQVAVRYWNFPYADKSLDWGIALAANGKSYLILAGSRESAFFAIDQLMQ